MYTGGKKGGNFQFVFVFLSSALGKRRFWGGGVGGCGVHWETAGVTEFASSAVFAGRNKPGAL